ncbi:MAG: class I SAM-dependent rRNA methyltransferase [Eubacteriales bacterium]|nr:class I SAM-dependent rRNA methyltransferase [Eubacteriales bacterium]MDD3882512.1 class I SAM-dependent rRNA methyltransferase [Eubacteriales bacterium]MDD4512812.1 class I SAM-dependent rRNA methyltransferase [Eubacteriales bacterium]
MADAILIRGKESRVYSGHPWVFRSDIAEVKGECNPGDVVNVLSQKGAFLAKAVYNPKSQIALRILSRKNEKIDREFIFGRVKRAVDYRRSFADLRSCRMIFAESDGLPAVIVDSFGGVLVLQCLSLGMEQFKNDIADALCEELKPDGIYERNDVPVRELEGLEQKTGLLRGSVPDLVEMSENGVRFLVDVKNGQKTGFFLDQKENRAAIAPFCKGAKVLDCFTHTGSFALHAGHFGASEVTGVDISEYAVKCAEENARLNGLSGTVGFKAANVFDLLHEELAEKKSYDMVILDPPAFTKTRSAVAGATRGYKEINLRGMQLVRDGGYLVTCSCSQHILPDMFTDIIKDAMRDARVSLRQVEYRTQGRDHPILPASPETQYLKCGIYQVFK